MKLLYVVSALGLIGALACGNIGEPSGGGGGSAGGGSAGGGSAGGGSAGGGSAGGGSAGGGSSGGGSAGGGSAGGGSAGGGSAGGGSAGGGSAGGGSAGGGNAGGGSAGGGGNVPAYCAAGGPMLWANLEACGWAGPANTGYPVGTTLANTSGRTITVDNTVISGERITGSLVVQAHNVTIKNCSLSYDGGGAGGSGVIVIEAGYSATVDHVEINGLNHTHACIWHQGSSMTARAVNCYGVNDGIFSWNQGTGHADSGDNFTIEDSYFHDLTHNAANGHIDGYQTEGAAHGVIRHNTYDLAGDADSDIALWNGQKTTDDILVEHNLMTGGGFAVYADDYIGTGNASAQENVANSNVGGYSVTNVKFLNNAFSTSQSPHSTASTNRCVGSYGVRYFRGSWPPYFGGPTDLWSGTGSTRTGNVIIESGQSLDNGNISGCT